MAELEGRFFQPAPADPSRPNRPVLLGAPALFSSPNRMDQLGRTEGGPECPSLDNDRPKLVESLLSTGRQSPMGPRRAPRHLHRLAFAICEDGLRYEPARRP